jgi:hypothetical protein
MPRGEGIYDDEDTEEPAGEGGDGGEAHDVTPDMAETGCEPTACRTVDLRPLELVGTGDLHRAQGTDRVH